MTTQVCSQYMHRFSWPGILRPQTHLSDFFSLSFIIAPVLVICISAILALIMGAAEEWGYKPAFWYVHEYAIVSVLMSAAGGMGL